MQYKQDIHLMIDIETMGTDSDSSVFEICIVPFLPEGGKVDLGEDIFHQSAFPLSDGLSYSQSTLDFWLKSNFTLLQKIIAESEGRTGLELWSNLVNYLLEMAKKYNIKGVWGNGPAFDQTILRNGIAKYLQTEHYANNHTLQLSLALFEGEQKMSRRDPSHYLLPFYLDLDVRTSKYALLQTGYTSRELEGIIQRKVNRTYESSLGENQMQKHYALFDCLYQI